MIDLLAVLFFPALGMWLIARQIGAWRSSRNTDRFLEDPNDWGAQ